MKFYYPLRVIVHLFSAIRLHAFLDFIRRLNRFEITLFYEEKEEARKGLR